MSRSVFGNTVEHVWFDFEGLFFSGDCKLLCGCYFTRIVCLLYEKCTKLEVTLS